VGNIGTYPCQELDRVDPDCDAVACALFIQHNVLTTNIISWGGGNVIQTIVQTQFAVSSFNAYTPVRKVRVACQLRPTVWTLFQSYDLKIGEVCDYREGRL
jgi:hypothetical protein